jgi:hypothetical protein
MQLDDKERFSQLSDAATLANFRQMARTNSGWFFTLSAGLFLPAAFLLPDVWGVGCLLCAIAAAAGGVYGMRGDNLKSVLLMRIGISCAITIFSVYCAVRPSQQWAYIFALYSGRLAINSLLRFLAYRKVQHPPQDVQEQVASAFSKATKSDPTKTPGLIALQRETGVKLLVPKDDAAYEFRLLFEKDLVFIIGINSFGGIRYSPRIRCFAPSYSFHLDVVGESWGGKRSKIRPMFGANPIHGDLEITPEMLMKARDQIARGSN